MHVGYVHLGMCMTLCVYIIYNCNEFSCAHLCTFPKMWHQTLMNLNSNPFIYSVIHALLE